MAGSGATNRTATAHLWRATRCGVSGGRRRPNIFRALAEAGGTVENRLGARAAWLAAAAALLRTEQAARRRRYHRTDAASRLLPAVSLSGAGYRGRKRRQRGRSLARLRAGPCLLLTAAALRIEPICCRLARAASGGGAAARCVTYQNKTPPLIAYLRQQLMCGRAEGINSAELSRHKLA